MKERIDAMKKMTLALALLLAFDIASALAQPFAYIPDWFNNRVVVIDTSTRTIVGSVPVGAAPMGAAVAPNGERVYVTNSDDSTVSVLDAATNLVIATIVVGSRPRGVAVTPDGSFVYVANDNSADVSVIDASSNTVVTTLPIGGGPTGIVVSPDGRRVYVASSSGVAVVDTSTNALTATIPIGQAARNVAVSPDGAAVYVTTVSQDVPVIDTTTNTVATTVAVGGSPFGVAVAPDGRFVYVTKATNSEVAVIDAASRAVVATIAVGDLPTGVAVTPDGRFVYVPNIFDETVSVIETLSNTVVARLPVGGASFAFGLFIGPEPNRTPSPHDDSYSATVNTPLNVGAPGVLANDTDDDGDALEASVVSGPTNGTLALSSDGAFIYTPASGFAGLDAFTYRASDGKASATAVASVTVSYPSCGISVTPVALGQPYVAIPYLQGLGTSADGKYTFSVTAGALPPGLHLASAFGRTGIIGIPQAPGSYWFEITASRSGTNCRDSRSYTVTIPKTVVPLLTCLQKIGRNTYRGTFGFENTTGVTQAIPVGANNYFTPGAQNRGQTTTFSAGTATNAFTVTFTVERDDNDIAVWFLRGPDNQKRSVTVTKSTYNCQ